eukprot:4082937-Ditylum_brightwellii.AAC.1
MGLGTSNGSTKPNQICKESNFCWEQNINNMCLVNKDEGNESDQQQMMTQQEFPFQICKIALPSCQT